MIESATLSTGERTRRQIERLRQDAAAHPDDPELQLHYASLLLTDGRIDEASAEFRVLLSKNAEPRVWEEAGRFLLLFEQYSLARDFLARIYEREALVSIFNEPKRFEGLLSIDVIDRMVTNVDLREGQLAGPADARRGLRRASGLVTGRDVDRL